MSEQSVLNHMKIKKIESKLPNVDVDIKSAEQMDNNELATWYAFCNALKFINLGEKSFHEEVRERDIPYNAILNYTQTVSGDIVQYLNTKKGIPLKYSLDVSMEESRRIDEIDIMVE